MIIINLILLVYKQYSAVVIYLHVHLDAANVE